MWSPCEAIIISRQLWKPQRAKPNSLANSWQIVCPVSFSKWISRPQWPLVRRNYKLTRATHFLCSKSLSIFSTYYSILRRPRQSPQQQTSGRDFVVFFLVSFPLPFWSEVRKCLFSSQFQVKSIIVVNSRQEPTTASLWSRAQFPLYT